MCSQHTNTCGDVMVDALHRDSGVENRVSLQITHKALNAAVNLQTRAWTNTFSECGSKTGLKGYLRMWLCQ